jgi:hypothetical protein
MSTVNKNVNMINQISAGYVFGNMLRSKGIIGIRNVGQIDKEKSSLVTYKMVLPITDPYIIFSFDDFL